MFSENKKHVSFYQKARVLFDKRTRAFQKRMRAFSEIRIPFLQMGQVMCLANLYSSDIQKVLHQTAA